MVAVALQQRRHKGHGVVRFQVSRAVGDDAVGRAMAFVEAITGEFDDQVEEFRDFVFGVPIGHAALNETLSLLLHRFGNFFAHGLA